MARSIETIYNEIVAEKDNQNTLSGLLPNQDNLNGLFDAIKSNSKVAIWRLWAYVVAVAIHVHESFWDIFKSEIEDLAAAAPAGTPRWYQNQMFIFQYGDSLIYQDDKYQYAVLDESKQIVKRCAIEERNDGVVLIKVAKDDSGNAIPLTTDEKDALTSYANKIKFAGTQLGIVSLTGDVIDIGLEVFYDPIEPLTDVQTAIQTAMDDYLSNLDFNGQFRVTDLIDKIQLVEGVKDAQFQNATGTPSGQSAISFDRVYTPLAGYMSFNDTAENMFTWTIEL